MRTPFTSSRAMALTLALDARDDEVRRPPYRAPPAGTAYPRARGVASEPATEGAGSGTDPGRQAAGAGPVGWTWTPTVSSEGIRIHRIG